SDQTARPAGQRQRVGFVERPDLEDLPESFEVIGLCPPARSGRDPQHLFPERIQVLAAPAGLLVHELEFELADRHQRAVGKTWDEHLARHATSGWAMGAR